MKTQLNHCKKQGSVLVITMTILAVALMALAGYLYTVQYEVGSVDRSQTWNSAISLAEAGMEEGMATINYGTPSGIVYDAYAWTNVFASETNWLVTGGTNATITRNLPAGSSNYYTVNIIWSGTNGPTVTSAGVVSYSSVPWEFSSLGQHAFLAATGSGNGSSNNNTVTMGRKIQVTTVLSPLFSAGVICKSNLNMNGNGCTIDSFDSSSTTYSVGGQWNANCRKANGNVATGSVITNTLSIGNGNIYGYVFTGPGTSQACVSIGPNGVVGDSNWVSTSSGIETGHWKGNFNATIPDVAPPNTTGWATNLPLASNGVITLKGGTNYVLASLSSALLIAGNTTMWVKGSPALGVSFTNGAQLILFLGDTTGSTSLSWSGQGTCNMPGYANNLQIYGLPSFTSCDLHGNAGFVATIYAPECAFTGGGGGNNAQDTSGALVVKSISLKGHWNFHYDEALAATGASRGWIATGWKEVSYP